VPVEPESVEMAQYFWYIDAGKAARELGFSPRDPADTLRDTVTYIKQNLLGGAALAGGPWQRESERGAVPPPAR
jgi:hypothetical protein